jgi:hypothetical protein
LSFAKETGAKITFFFAKPDYPVAFYGEGALIDPTTPDKFSEMAEKQAQEILAVHEAIAKAEGVSSASDFGQRHSLRSDHRRGREVGRRSDLHGFTRPTRNQRAAARLGNAESTHSFKDSGAGLSVTVEPAFGWFRH